MSYELMLVVGERQPLVLSGGASGLEEVCRFRLGTCYTPELRRLDNEHCLPPVFFHPDFCVEDHEVHSDPWGSRMRVHSLGAVLTACSGVRLETHSYLYVAVQYLRELAKLYEGTDELVVAFYGY